MDRTISDRHRFIVACVKVVVAGTTAVLAACAQAQVRPSDSWESLLLEDLDEVEVFLATAEIIENTKIPTGTTGPRKLLLEKNRVRAYAVFKDVDERDRGRKRIQGLNVTDFHDYHLYDCAAYRLDRLLGLGRVPPSVPRVVKGRAGTVTLWIEGTIMEKTRQSRGLEPPDAFRWEQQRRIMAVFDNLIGNLDPNLGNILIDQSWTLWFIDHTRAFVTSTSLPNPGGVTKCERGFYTRLRELDPEVLRRELEPYLNGAEMDALLARRERILGLLADEIDARGEKLVLFDLRPARSSSEEW